MKKSALNPFQHRFCEHVFKFLEKILSSHERYLRQVIAVSGGVDSMVLLWVAHQLSQEKKIGPLRVLFIHHQTRSGQEDEARLVKNFCRKLSLPCKVLYIQGLAQVRSNFEQEARSARRQQLLQDLDPQERLWLGQHIDDSYEWSLMQRSRSSQAKTSLGIPVRNGKILRPFMCVTKSQIRKLAKISKIPSLEDPTNLDTRFERNFFRQEVIPLIQKRYPQYLKHYVNQANHLARIFKLSYLHEKINQEVYVYEQGAIILGEKYSKEEVQELLHQYSQFDRGKISSQLEKMLKAIENGKRGPFHFSGGTEAYFSFHLLMVYRQKSKNNDADVAKFLGQIKNFNSLDLPLMSIENLRQSWKNLLATKDAMLNMPGLVIVLESKSILKTLNTSVYDTLFPEVSKICQTRGFRFVSALKLLETWEKKKIKLPDSLRLLPLWTMSNLFTSQE